MTYRVIRYLLDPDPQQPSGGGTSAASTPAKPAQSTPAKEPKMVRVDTPKAVPEHIKKQEFSIDSFDPLQPSGHGETGNRTTSEVLKGKEAKVEPPVKPAEQPPKVEPAKEPESVLKPPTEKPRDDKGQFVAKSGKEKIESVQLPGQQQGQDPINYADYTPEQQRYLKQMSNEAKVFVSDIVKQNKELKKLEGGSYLQHELAYTLDPKYNDFRRDIHFATKESNYWRDQLVLLSQGKPIKNLTGWNDKGQPILGQEFQPTKELEEEVRKLMIKSDNVAQAKQQELGQFSQNYKQRVAQDMVGIEEEMKKRFSWEADPKLLDFKLPIQFEDGERDVTLKQIKEDFIGMFPPYMRQNVGVRIAASMMIALRIGHAELAKLKGNQQVQQIQQQEQQRGEPGSEVRPNKPELKEVNGVKEFSLGAI